MPDTKLYVAVALILCVMFTAASAQTAAEPPPKPDPGTTV